MGQHSVSEHQLPSGEREVSAALLVTRDPAAPGGTAPDAATFRLQQQPDAAEPLRWFSALPPGALRDAQQQFRRAAEIGCDIASLKSQLQAMMAKLEDRRERGAGDGQVEETTELTEAVSALSVK